MRRLVLLAVLTAALAAPAAAGAASSVPWATVNVCDPVERPGAVGVRVAIPRRSGATGQWVRVRLQWFDQPARAWRRLRSGGDGGWTKIGDGGGAVAGGTTFAFRPPAAGSRIVLRGVADVEWRRGRRVLARAEVPTTPGHEAAGDPHLQVSRASCEIAR